MQKQNETQLEELNKLIRYWIITMTTTAGSGHPSSSMSGVELMSTLFFKGFLRYDPKKPESINNDRIIFSKGHAAPLYYAMWAAAGEIEAEELGTLRQFWSRLEGHPTLHFPFTDVATGSLGQGLSVGLGMALAADKLDKVGTYTWVFLGDSEMAEGQIWEAMELAAYYKCHNLKAIVDVNRLGQRGQTMLGHDLEVYKSRAESFGWSAYIVDGHNIQEIEAAYKEAIENTDKPTIIFAKTFKGRGVSFIEDKDNWHGRALDEQELQKALKEIGPVNEKLRASIAQPIIYKKGDEEVTQDTVSKEQQESGKSATPVVYEEKDTISSREAYGNGLTEAMQQNSRIVILDAEVSNSTKSATAKKVFPERFFEMYIAEQNMASVAVGLALRGYVPYVSSFAAFLSRAHDQIRMAQFSNTQMICVGTHPGVSIGADGSSQMALEDLAFFRAILGSVVLYPSDATSTHALTVASASLPSIVYIRATRESTPVLYASDEEFPIGGSKILCTSIDDRVTIVAAGITVHEALLAYKILKEEDIVVRVIDAYSIKPIDARSIRAAAADTHNLIVVEDHYPEGGLGDAVRTALDSSAVTITHLAVRKAPRSGQTAELLAYEEIDAQAIARAVRKSL